MRARFLSVAVGVLILACPTGRTSADRIVAWGSNAVGQCDVPTGDRFVSIASGHYHGVALRAEGWLVSWGDNTYGQVDNTPTGNDFVAITARLWIGEIP